MHVLVAGAGVGGLTAALSLRRRGAEVTVLEQASALGEAGAGIQLSPNATRILIDLGLGPAIQAVACEPHAIEMREGRGGRLLMRLPLAQGEARWGAPYLHLHRADLQQILLDALQADGKAKLHLGAQVHSVNGTAVRLQGGDTLFADAVVGCDGIRSAVRTALLGDAPPRFTGQVAWRGLVPAERLPADLARPAARAWLGPGKHFVCYPVRGGALVNFIGVVERPDWRIESWTEPGDPADLARDFAGWDAPVRVIVAAATDAWRWALFDRDPLPCWSFGPVSLLGDAAHPMLPFLAQGAAMAVEDAEALARHLAGGAAPEAALKAYETERRARTARVQAMSRRNAALFHLPSLAARAAFAAAGALDRLDPSGGMARLDWLYGYGCEKPKATTGRTE